MEASLDCYVSAIFRDLCRLWLRDILYGDMDLLLVYRCEILVGVSQYSDGGESVTHVVGDSGHEGRGQSWMLLVSSLSEAEARVEKAPGLVWRRTLQAVV